MEDETKEAKAAVAAVTRERDAKVTGMERDLLSRSRIIEGLKESLTTKEENYNMLMQEKDSLEQTMELLLEEANKRRGMSGDSPSGARSRRGGSSSLNRSPSSSTRCWTIPRPES